MTTVNELALAHKIISFVDPHLSLLIIEHYEKNGQVDAQKLLQEKIGVLSKTKIYDYFTEELEKLAKQPNSQDNIKRLSQGKDLYF